MEGQVRFSANKLEKLLIAHFSFFTYFLKQCAAVMAQFSFNNTAPQKCRISKKENIFVSLQVKNLNLW